jgi:hypothetical protein
MRTKLLVAAAITAAGLATSMAQSNVYSLNVVGYVNKVFLGTGQYSMIANPLNSTNNTIGGVLAVPTGTQVLKFDPNLGDYVTYTKVVFGNGWSPPAGATVSLAPGEGVLVKSPGASGDITNTFVGEVLQGSLTNTYAVGYNLSGNKVPDSGLVTTLGLTSPAVPNGTQLLKFDPNIQDYATFTKVIFGAGWSPSVPSLDVGEGFFIKNNGGSPFDWVRNFTVQ